MLASRANHREAIADPRPGREECGTAGGFRDLTSPILRDLSNSFFGDPSLVDRCDDAELYGCITMAVSCLYGPEFDDVVEEPVRRVIQEKVELRLERGWFSETALSSPQSRCAAELPELGHVELEADEQNPAVAAKPRQAVWTGSLLPDGASSLDTVRSPVTGERDKTLHLIEFDPADVRVYLIDEPEDWRRLGRDYPVRCSDGTIGVSWRAMSADYDAMELRDWDAESSAWFRFPPGARVSRARR